MNRKKETVAALTGLTFLALIAILPMVIAAIWLESWKLAATAGVVLIIAIALANIIDYLD